MTLSRHGKRDLGQISSESTSKRSCALRGTRFMRTHLKPTIQVCPAAARAPEPGGARSDFVLMPAFSSAPSIGASRLVPGIETPGSAAPQ